jgi:hypothetical protein
MNRHLVESEKWTSTCPSSVGRKFQLFAAAIMFGSCYFLLVPKSDDRYSGYSGPDID